MDIASETRGGKFVQGPEKHFFHVKKLWKQKCINFPVRGILPNSTTARLNNAVASSPRIIKKLPPNIESLSLRTTEFEDKTDFSIKKPKCGQDGSPSTFQPLTEDRSGMRWLCKCAIWSLNTQMHTSDNKYDHLTKRSEDV